MPKILDVIMDPPEAVYHQVRTKCPFYGFSLSGGAMMDRGGNQCALKDGSQSPCSLQISGHFPEWNQCAKHDWPESQEAFVQMLLNAQVFPEEFRPRVHSRWSGIPLWWWWFYIMDENQDEGT